MSRIIRRKLDITPLFHQTDMMGVIHNAQYFIWFEQGRLQILWDIMTFDEAVAKNIAVPVVSNRCDYLRAIRFGDPLVLLTEHRISQTWEGKLVFTHSLVHARKKIEMARGETAVAIIDMAQGQQLVREWPADIWQRYQALA